MAQTGTPSTASLIRPLRLQDILIKGEIVRYNERRHWAILIQPFLETVSVLTFITLFAGGFPTNAFGGFIILFALAMVIYRIRRNQWRRSAVYLAIVSLLIGMVVFSVSGLAVWAIIVTAGRFIYRATMWAFYRRLYITNRRIIGARGFLGAKIDTMPLTRLTDINFERSVWGELLGYGRIRVETAGQDQALGLLEFVDRSNVFYAMIIELSTAAVGSVTDAAGKKGDPSTTSSSTGDDEADIDSDDGAGTRDPDN